MNANDLAFQRLYQAIRAADRVLLVADASPDGDSLGSSSAMLNWLKREQKNVTAFINARIPQAFHYLDGIQDYTSDPNIFSGSFDLIITFDAGDLKHGGIDQLLPKLPNGYRLFVLDHHATNTRFGHENIVITEAGSTCEVVYRFFQANQIAIDERMATSMLTGIFTDTSNFTNPATTPLGMEAAAKLIGAGARVTDILNRVIKNKSVEGLRLWGVALSRLHQHPTLNVATTYFLKEDIESIPNGDEAVEGMSNFLNAACVGCDTVLVLREVAGGKIKGSLRSINHDISKLAQRLGGGGHKKAAGFTVNGRLEVKDGVVKVVE